MIFAACLGTWLLRERMSSIRAIGAIFIALGAVAIRFSG